MKIDEDPFEDYVLVC